MMPRFFSLLVTFFVVASHAQAAQREITVFSDGSLVEIEAVAQKGLAETTLPGQIRAGSLRVKPLDTTGIGQVTLVPFRMPDKVQRELDQLTEQKELLEDRLKALDTKEEIFEAAAKSQSSKAPRKSKTNPDPLTSVRQGTAFAIAQLEAVITARRRTEQELKRVSGRIAQLTKNAVGGPTVRTTVGTPNGRVRVAAVLADNGWRPRYELRLNGTAHAGLTQLADIDTAPAGFTIRLAPASLANGLPLQTVPALSGRSTRLAEWQLPVINQQSVIGPLSSFTITLQNTTGSTLPTGEVAIYIHGEFLGTAPLPAAAPNANLTITNRH